MQILLLSLLLATAPADTSNTAEEQRLYVLGSSLNLRKEPSKDAEVLEKLRIGTECRVTEKLEGEWLKVCCGGRGGYAAATLLGAEKPSVEALKAQAEDDQLPLSQREESALRAAILSPEDAELQKLLGNLFFERNLEQLARLKKPKTLRTFVAQCFNQSDAACIEDQAASSLKGVKVRAETRGNLFVVAVGDAERVVVHRGRYKLDEMERLTGQILESAGFATTPVMGKALFFDREMREYDDRWAWPLGQFVLDEASHALLDKLPRKWGILEPSPPKGFLKMQWNGCSKSPFLMEFKPDIHGRWMLKIDIVGDDNATEVHWISAVSRLDNALELTLEAYSVRNKKTRQELFKLSEGSGDIAHLGDKAYSFKLHRYAEVHHPCRQGGP